MNAVTRPRAADLVVTSALTVAVLGPLLVGGGYWLLGDMVFVPRQPWKDAWLGLDTTLPRAVPMDALVSLATHVVPGSVVQRVLLAAGFVAGGLGTARLVADRAWYARAAAITLLCWNPWVAERLLIGQWAILLGYLLLPWVAHAALRLRDQPRDWGPAAVALVLAAVCGPSSGVMAAVVLAILALGRDRRVWWRAAALALTANLTWAVPALTATATVATDGVFTGFAARAESAAGTVASVLSLGGIWKASIVPPERTSATLVLLSCLLTLAALLGLARSGHDRARWAILGAASVVVALLPTLPGGAGLLEGLAEPVRGLVLLRDSHRFLAPLGLVLAVGVAHAVTWLRGRIRRGTGALWGAVALVAVAPVLLLPSLAWGASGELQRSAYPPAWTDVAGLVGPDETTVVLPWAGSYRGFAWNHRRAVLDPAPRILPGEVLVDDRVVLTDRVVPAEDPRSAVVSAALARPDPAAALRSIGVRWVLVEEGMGDPDVPAGRTAYAGGGLRLVDLSAGGAVATPADAEERWRTILVGAGHASTVLLLLWGLTWILTSRE